METNAENGFLLDGKWFEMKSLMKIESIRIEREKLKLKVAYAPEQ